MTVRKGQERGEQQAIEIIVAIGVGLLSYVVLLCLGAVVEHFAGIRLTDKNTLGDVFFLGSACVAFLVMLGFLYVTRRR